MEVYKPNRYEVPRQSPLATFVEEVYGEGGVPVDSGVKKEIADRMKAALTTQFSPSKTEVVG